MKQNNDEELGKEVLYQKLYPGHVYESLNLGHVSDLESITLDDVKSYYTEQLTQSNLNVGITGNLASEQKQMMLHRITNELNAKGADQAIRRAQ